MNKPWDWADGLIKRQGPHRAAKIADREARELIGPSKLPQQNPNRPYFLHALNFILKRYPKALETMPDKVTI